jgi:hypothetical protein
MGSRGISLLFLDHDTRRGEGLASSPSHSLSPGKTRYPLYRRLCGPQGRYGQVRKISSSPGFDTWTVQPVASRYTDLATGPTDKFKCKKIKKELSLGKPKVKLRFVVLKRKRKRKIKEKNKTRN